MVSQAASANTIHGQYIKKANLWPIVLEPGELKVTEPACEEGLSGVIFHGLRLGDVRG